VIGLDYSAGRISGVDVADAGHKFVMRYLWFPGQRHAYLTAEEARDLRAAGIAIGLIFESIANRAVQGWDAGVADANIAAAQLADVGAPADQVIYFTIDFDASEGQQPAIDDYFRGAASVVGIDRVGCYAGYWPLSRLLDSGLVRYGWQTLAWSGDNREARAALFQNGDQATVGGVECDINELSGPAGLWGSDTKEDDVVSDVDRAAIVEDVVAAIKFRVLATPGDDDSFRFDGRNIIDMLRQTVANTSAGVPVAGGAGGVPAMPTTDLTEALRPLVPEIVSGLLAALVAALEASRTA
jgi:hypothetical protein